MAVLHAQADIYICDNVNFEKVNNPIELHEQMELFELTFEKGELIDHKIETFSELVFLISEGINIYKEVQF